MICLFVFPLKKQQFDDFLPTRHLPNLAQNSRLAAQVAEMSIIRPEVLRVTPAYKALQKCGEAFRLTRDLYHESHPVLDVFEAFCFALFQACFRIMIRMTPVSIDHIFGTCRWAERRDQQLLVPLLAWQFVEEDAHPHGAVQWFTLDSLRHMRCLHSDGLVFLRFVARLCSCGRRAGPFLNVELGDWLLCCPCDLRLVETTARSLLWSHLHQWGKPKAKSVSHFEHRRDVEKIPGDVGALGPQLEWATLVLVRDGSLFEMQKGPAETASSDHEANIYRSMLNRRLLRIFRCHAGYHYISHWPHWGPTGAPHGCFGCWCSRLFLCLNGIAWLLFFSGGLGKEAGLRQFWPGQMSLLRISAFEWNWPTSLVWSRGVEAMCDHLVW